MASIKHSLQLLLTAFILFSMQCSIFIEATKSNSGFKNITVACIAEERKALLKHKQGLKDPSGQLSTWVGEDCCKWTGVG
ncbi:putative leucine-rich repeat-containing, plant-type [Rosa chinensis]|uniref:Putative leucine-rich repeat-containing, plant-type n=1 Tax=Rosa chinensis TaxID=74649 RepID=A0A2P6SIC1_ROSCH|nr:putative leucine-rich repeat-containing, plant-type [Rosa chinensis]